jgi:hypothetical protein
MPSSRMLGYGAPWRAELSRTQDRTPTARATAVEALSARAPTKALAAHPDLQIFAGPSGVVH